MFWKAATVFSGFYFFGFLIPPCWNEPCAVSNWWFIKRSAGVAHSHDNKSEVFTFVFPRDVWARPLLPLNHRIRHTVPAAVIPHQLFAGTVSEREHLFRRDKHHRSIVQWSSTHTTASRYIICVWLWLQEEAESTSLCFITDTIREPIRSNRDQCLNHGGGGSVEILLSSASSNLRL